MMTEAMKPTTIEPPAFIIHTLGRFDVIRDNRSLVNSAAGSRKIWELYKFMLTHRERSFTPESLMSQLWVSEDYSDPRSTLRRQMHRMRQTLGESDVREEEKTLLFSNGYYRWNERLLIQLDTDIFEDYIAKGDALKNTDPQLALHAYNNALSVYMGDYLPECADQHWVFPIRNHYRRQFLKAILNAIELFKLSGAYDQILPLCQKAIRIDIYEETFHLSLMDALLHQGEQKQALEHYEYITGFYYRELGVKPSAEMRTLYKRLLKSNVEIHSTEGLHDALESDNALDNAFYCEPEVFKSIYELERRRLQRSGNGFSIGVIAPEAPASRRSVPEDPQMSRLKEQLMTRLRKGDTFTRWNERQYVVLLSEIDGTLAEKVLSRVLNTGFDNPSAKIMQITSVTSESQKNLSDTVEMTQKYC